MKPRYYVYVDGTNFLKAATPRGSWHCDYKALYRVLGGEQIDRALFVTSGAFNALDYVESAGFELAVMPRRRAQSEKRVDTYLTAQALVDGFTRADAYYHTFRFVTGDLDQEPAITALRKAGYEVEVWFWGCASKELRAAASTFVNMRLLQKELTYEATR